MVSEVLVVLRCFKIEPIKWLIFDVQTLVSVLYADQFHVRVFQKLILQDLLQRENEITLKGFVKGFLEKKQFIQQGEMSKKV